MSPANFPVGHFSSPFKQNRNEGLMAWCKRPYSNGLITCQARLCFCLFSFSLDSAWQFNMSAPWSMSVPICPLQGWLQRCSTAFLLQTGPPIKGLLAAMSFRAWWFLVLILASFRGAKPYSVGLKSPLMFTFWGVGRDQRYCSLHV